MEIFHLIINILLSLIVVIATVLPLIKHEYWIVRFFDFPYVQFTIVNVAVIPLWIWYFDHMGVLEVILISILGIGLMYRAYIIFPYTILSSKEVSNAINISVESTFKIISSNVLMYNDDYNGLINLIKDEQPEILLLVETDEKWEQEISNEFKNVYEYNVLKPLDNTYGMLLYSKYKLEDPKIQYRIEDDVPSIEAIVVLNESEKFHFFGLHPKPPSPSENKTSLPRDAELVMVGKDIKELDLPVLVAGDLNDVAWSHTTRLFTRISGLLDPRIGRGFYNTYPANHALLRWPLDHMFVSSEFEVISVQRLDNFHSDHFSMCMEVMLNSSKKTNKEKEQPDEEDKKEADKKIERAI